MHQIFGGFLRHIGTFLDHLGGVDTPVGSMLVPTNWAKLSKYMGWGEVNISASIGPHAPNCFLRFPRHIGTFLDQFGGVNTSMGGASVPKTWAKLSKYIREWGGQYLSFY